MVPMGMGLQEQKIFHTAAHQAVAEQPHTRSRIQNDNAVVDDNFNAGGITAIFHMIGRRGRD